ncbi:MAG: hypothetical protein ACRDWG_12105 [Actinomycetes bacterium]
MKLPEHTIDRSGGAVLVTFAEPMDPTRERAAHAELAKLYPGASIATIGARQVAITQAAGRVPAKRATTRRP